ncbi:hypothetical protein [Marinobacter sp. F4218]|uniref:hypothetical protein n=1 Tax=Marinobacter sp. F4218 TaxID=2862868 RepID=UPI001C635AD7|nr:hypothetical protein [Marinobacter sp. F4218]MBW7470453.1 hypothetical protein [Marinobacter sp. F4218]
MTQLKNGNFQRNLFASAILAPMMILAGCSGSDYPTQESPAGTGAVSGFAYDGYLRGAKVCVDENLNKQCDDGEPSSETVNGGQFSIEGLTDAQLLTPMVVEADANTIDEDSGQLVDVNLKLLAPAGTKAISGFSTIVQMQTENALAAGSVASISEIIAEQEAQLRAAMGLADNIDLLSYDPVALKNDDAANDSARRAAATAHLVNQVISQNIATLLPQAEANANGENAAAFGALVNNIDAVAINAAVQNDVSGLALPELVNADRSYVPEAIAVEVKVPTTQEIGAQALQDEIANAAIQLSIENEETPTGGTGGTGS